MRELRKTGSEAHLRLADLLEERLSAAKSSMEEKQRLNTQLELLRHEVRNCLVVWFPTLDVVKVCDGTSFCLTQSQGPDEPAALLEIDDVMTLFGILEARIARLTAPKPQVVVQPDIVVPTASVRRSFPHVGCNSYGSTDGSAILATASTA